MKKLPGRLPKLIFVLILALCSPLVSLAQPAQEEAAMERFDIEAFNRNKDGYSWIHTLLDGTKVWQRENFGKGYQVETTPAYSAYTEIKLFNYDGNLIFKQLNFFSFAIGISQEYDAQGNVIKEYDMNAGFAFSINDLIQKMKEEYKIDITDTRQVFKASRGIDLIAGQETPLYGLYVYDFPLGKTDTTQAVAYLFHGGTGELLYTVPADIEGSPSILRVYKQWLEHQQHD